MTPKETTFETVFRIHGQEKFKRWRKAGCPPISIAEPMIDRMQAKRIITAYFEQEHPLDRSADSLNELIDRI